MSARNFSRLFTEETGEPPGRFVQRVRVEAARELLEHSELSLAEIADRVGLGTAESLRRRVQHELGVFAAALTDRRRASAEHVGEQ